MTEWEGSRIYDRAWAGVYDLVLPEHSDDEVWEAMKRGQITQSVPFYRWILAGLNDAHVVEIDHEQIAALPNMSEDEGIDYAQNARLPFDPLFIGFSGVAELQEIERRRATDEHDELMKVSPAMAVTHTMLNGRRVGDFAIGALVTTRNPVDSYVGVKTLSWEDEEDGTKTVTEDRHHPPVALSIIPFFDMDGENRTFGWRSTVGGRIVHALGAYCLHAEKKTWAFLTPNPEADFDSPEDREDMRVVEESVRFGTKIACEIAYFLESYNVELVEQEVSRQVRRQAERKNKRISLVVHIRQPKSRSKPEARNGEKRDFSHRFEVRGHYKYFPQGTRLADALPEDKLTHVPGRGLCRKVWCPPFVKGPTDKPLIPKVRVVHPAD